MIQTPHSRVVLAVLVLGIALAVGSVARWASLRGAPDATKKKRMASLATWWVLAVILGSATLAGIVGISLLLCLASLVAVWELGRLVSTTDGRIGTGLVATFAVLHYVALVRGASVGQLMGLQWALMLVLAMIYLIRGCIQGYVRVVAGLSWGSWILVFGLSHAGLLARLPDETNPIAGSVGWFLYLILLTESNDIAQALVGRRWGRDKRHRIAPTVSPNKTWEGFLGGLLVTVALAVALAPWLTPLASASMHWGDAWNVSIPGLPAVLAGMIVVVCGFLGDINMSAVKRDAGAKDSSQFLPGMGGMIDRIDSLTFAAPAFYWFVACGLG